jgi:hypothetical protein
MMCVIVLVEIVNVIEMLLVDSILSFYLLILNIHHLLHVILLHFSLLSDYFLLNALLSFQVLSLSLLVVAHFGD